MSDRVIAITGATGNLGRVVAVLMGYDFLPGTTITRYCSSSLQSTRMAFHAIKAGEGDAYLSAGVECVSRYGNGRSDGIPDTHNAAFATARSITSAAASKPVSSSTSTKCHFISSN